MSNSTTTGYEDVAFAPPPSRRKDWQRSAAAVLAELDARDGTTAIPERGRVATSLPIPRPQFPLTRFWSRWGGVIFILIGFAAATYLTANWINTHALITSADARVGMLEETGLPSHFTADNHGGAVTITWWPGGDYLKSRILTGANLGDMASDVQPRLSFRDVDGDGRVDVVLTMNRNCYFLPSNGKDGFSAMQGCTLVGVKLCSAS